LTLRFVGAAEFTPDIVMALMMTRKFFASPDGYSSRVSAGGSVRLNLIYNANS